MNYHGTSLVVKKRGILLLGKSGVGKSDLALRLISQGATLIADDQTKIVAKGGQLLASCPKTLEGKLEVRGLGIIEVPFLKKHPLHLIIDLVSWQDIERLPLRRVKKLQGIECLCYELDPFEASALDKMTVILSR